METYTYYGESEVFMKYKKKTIAENLQMAFMNYTTPGLAKIEFEDSLFVTTEMREDENKEVKRYIESRGGVIKDSVTKDTDYLIYRDGLFETEAYRKALELVTEKGVEIRILPLSLFYILCKGEEFMEFGTYPYETDGTRRRVKWVLLKRENNRALLLSAYGIDVKPYNEEWESVTWETCTLRKWLNEDFFKDAFTEEEKNKICLTKIENPDNQRYGTKGGNDTEDRVFLLSIREAETLLPERTQRMKIETPFAEEKDIWEGAWWLRSPGMGSDDAAGVYSDGDIDVDGYYVSYRGAVCPALWIDLESEISPCAANAKSPVPALMGPNDPERSIIMAIMNYTTPGLAKIVFEGSVFVTTQLREDENKEVKRYIESRGGVIKDSVTKTTDYLIYGDGLFETEAYRKALELIRDKELEIGVLPLSLFWEVGIGEGIMDFGSYPCEADGTKKPIRWIVLKREEKKALLLSAYGLDAKPYNEEREDVTWETCTLRKWLNGDFYTEAFTEEEKKRICLTEVRNEDNPSYKTPGGNDTEDRVFLLSISEMEQYLPESLVRKRKPTPFAKERGAYTWSGNCWWWLRLPGYFPTSAAMIHNVGVIYGYGSLVDYSYSAVCPALWIDLESGIE